MVSILLLFITTRLVFVNALFRVAFLVRVTVGVLLVILLRGVLVVVVHITEGTVAACPLSMKLRGQYLKHTSGEASQWFGSHTKSLPYNKFLLLLTVTVLDHILT